MNLFTSNFEELFSFDSHTHFFGVGLPATDFFIENTATTLELPSFLKSESFIRGFGWSDSMPFSEFDSLCKKYPDKYFFLSFVDGHKSFVSNNLIEKLNFKLNSKFSPLKYGVFLSEVERDNLHALLPSHSLEDLKKNALYAQNIFLKNKIKKVRHLTGTLDHWTCLRSLESEGALKIKVDVFFSEFMGQTLDESLLALKKAQKNSKKTPSEALKACGLKIFYDGSFSGNTAYVSSNKNSSARINKNALKERMTMVLCKQQTPLAIHTIGDLALKDCLEIYSDLNSKNKFLPEIHLEHAPIFSEASLHLLEQNKLNCQFHFQPSHWVEDQFWYNKNKDRLSPHQIYPFKFLEKNDYTYHFGSDAPVVDPTKENLLKGLKAIQASVALRNTNGQI